MTQLWTLPLGAWDHQVITAAFTISFSCFLWCGEVTLSQTLLAPLLVRSVTWQDDYTILPLPASKTNPFWLGTPPCGSQSWWSGMPIHYVPPPLPFCLSAGCPSLWVAWWLQAALTINLPPAPLLSSLSTWVGHIPICGALFLSRSDHLGSITGC